MQPFLKNDPRLAFRPMGSYLGRNFDSAHRMRIIVDTFRFVHSYGGNLHRALITPDGLDLVRVKLDKDRELVVKICSHSQFRKEGEVSVLIYLKPYDGCIASFAFALEQCGGAWNMRIGAVQGRRGGDEETIKIATKALHGLRPKSLAVFMAQEIARSLRMTALFGVGSRAHVFVEPKSLFTNSTKRSIFFDYDGLWEEHEGVAGPDHWYQLPLKTVRRTGDEIKPNKRGMYTKRYLLMDDISRQIKTVLPSFPR